MANKHEMKMIIFRPVPEKQQIESRSLTILAKIPVYAKVTQSFFINLIYVQHLIYVQPCYLIYVLFVIYVQICT